MEGGYGGGREWATGSQLSISLFHSKEKVGFPENPEKQTTNC